MGVSALFKARAGIDIGVHVISGEGAPDGGRADTAIVGSLYQDLTNAQTYVKKTSGSGTNKWVRVQNQDDMNAALLGMSWREPVVCKDATVYADQAAAETALNTGMIDGVAVTTNARILFTGITGANANIYLVSGTPGSGATLVEEGNSASRGDAMLVQYGTSAGHQLGYNGTAWVLQNQSELTEDGFIRTFIGKSAIGNETPDYTSNNIVTDSNSLETAIGALDAEIGSGVTGAQVRTAGTISDQAVNRNVEALDDAIGPNVTSTKHLTASASVNANLSKVDDILGDAKMESKTDAVTTATVLDSVKVDDVLVASWMVHARAVADPAQMLSVMVNGMHNGTGAADATAVDYNIFGDLKIGGAIAGLDFEVVLSGSGAAQVMQLKASCNSEVNIRITRSVLNEQ